MGLSFNHPLPARLAEREKRETDTYRIEIDGIHFSISKIILSLEQIMPHALKEKEVGPSGPALIIMQRPSSQGNLSNSLLKGLTARPPQHSHPTILFASASHLTLHFSAVEPSWMYSITSSIIRLGL